MSVRVSLRRVVRSAYRSVRPSIFRTIKRYVEASGIIRNGSAMPVGNGFEGFRPLAAYEPIEVSRPRYMVEEPLQTAQLKDYLENPNLKAYTGGVISARDVAIAYPSLAHSFRGKVFLEVLLDEKDNFLHPKILLDYVRMRFKRATPMPEAIMLALPMYGNYYHWIVEMLPRLLMIDSDPDLSRLPLLLPKRGTPAFVLDSLAFAGYGDRLQLMEDGFYSFARLHIPTLLSPPSHPSPMAIDWVRGKLLPHETRAKVGGRRIYVSRRDASIRYATNEAEVVACLERYGFETVVMGGHTLAQQMEIFRSASMIVGLHGAALTNLVFARSETFFLELFLEGWFTNAFYHLALIRRIHYGFLVCRKDGVGQHVDVEKLETLVKRMLADGLPPVPSEAASMVRA